jgi:steroid delta-isomerase-like uncharacterized protein
MSTQSNLQLVRDLIQAMDSRKVDQFSNFLAPDAEFKIVGMEMPMKGIQEIQKGFQDWSKAFPDMKTQILNAVASEDFVFIEYLSRGTHQGPLELEDGKVLQPTQRKVEVPACDVYRIVNGKIISAHVYWLSLVMLKQLGVLEQKKAAA